MSGAQPGALAGRPRGRRRLALALAALVGVAGASVPAPSHAAVGMTVECTFVKLDLYRLSSGAWKLVTDAPGLCAISDRDPVGLPWDAATLGSALFNASGGVTPTCSGSTLRGLSGAVTYSVRASDGGLLHAYPSLDFSLITETTSRATTMLMNGPLFTSDGVGAFVQDPDSRCVSAPSSGQRWAASWSLGEYVFEDPLA